eukprot:TRINITY_DN2242_c0_g1_i2.p1 TRINITY_DN2242_c0_g1~~TRINITY_DN2242_c0_g1_i2.p1  ORF type:complete len:512 (+),score=91.51 TRINITY_DN2242_c0_g1_i2:121-1656(+)
MAGGPISSSYNRLGGFIYVFNLIVGIGSLTMPKEFLLTGYVLSVLFILLLSSIAFVTVTYVLESCANGNAVNRMREQLGSEEYTETSALETVVPSAIRDAPEEAPNPPHAPRETTPLIAKGGEEVTFLSGDEENELVHSPSVFSLVDRLEMVKMADMYFGRKGQIAFYILLVVYLFGDLSIYVVSVPVTLQSVVGGFSIGSLHFDTETVYYVYLFLFAIIIIPFVFFDFTKTRWLQYIAMVMRNIALVLMIVIGVIFISEGEGASASDLTVANFAGIPKLYGVAVYSFMTHHSIPGFVEPIRKKSRLVLLFLVDWIVIYCSYMALCLTAVFAFGDEKWKKCGNNGGHPCQIQQLYTLNFESFNVKPIADYLAMYPVVTLTTNFPLIAITLRNNLEELYKVVRNRETRSKRLRPVFALCAAIPPFIIGIFIQNVSLLVNVTGSFPGIGIQYVVPALFVLASRRMLDKLGVDRSVNSYKSPVRRNFWVYAVLVWSAFSVGLATYNIVRVAQGH